MARTRSVQIETLDLPREFDSDRPKGDQIRERLESLAGRLGPGAMMPSDRQLAEYFGVARMTVRGEIQHLVTDGVLDVQRGRGTFVAEPQAPHEWGASYSLSLAVDAGVPGARLISKAITTIGERRAGIFGVSPASQALQLVRLRTLDDAPVGIESVTLPLERFPGLEDVAFDQVSLYSVLAERWGVHSIAVRGVASAVVPTEDESDLLDIDQGDPCIAVRMTSKDEHGQVFETGRSIYRGDRYQLAVDYRMLHAERS